MYYQWHDRIISLTDDLAFKKVFGSPEHSRITLDLLNSLMRQLGRPELTQIEILNPFSLADFKGAKEVAVDVHALADHSREFQIEMQVKTVRELPARLLDNWTRLYSRQIGQGEDYQVHKPLMAVWFLVEGIRGNRVPLRSYTLRDQEDQELIDHQALVLVDLQAWKSGLSGTSAQDKMDSGLQEWISAFMRRDVCRFSDQEILEEQAMGLWGEVSEIMKTLLRNDQAWYRNEARRRARMDRAAEMRWAETEGRAEGKLEGKIEGKIEDAHAMLAKGIAMETVLEITGLTLAQIENHPVGQKEE